MILNKKRKKKIILVIVTFLIVLNIVCFAHAYNFTHFNTKNDNYTPPIEELSTVEKIKISLLGIQNTRPFNDELPNIPFTEISISADINIHGWRLESEKPKGIIILFHGYRGTKSGMLNRAYTLNSIGYTVVLVDFMGSGGSEGNSTTLGYKEASQVVSTFNYVSNSATLPVYLLGTSMGATAVMRAIAELDIHPDGIIIEYPFGTLKTATKKRFRSMGLPPTPMAEVLLFWGGVQQGFNPFQLKPIEYAKQIKCNTLLLYGKKDERVSLNEINSIYKNLAGSKQLTLFANAGHEDFSSLEKEKYLASIEDWIQ